MISEATASFHESVTKRNGGLDRLANVARATGVDLTRMDLLKCLATCRMRQDQIPIGA